MINFVSIVSAVSIGRVVYDNIKKSISLPFLWKLRSDYCDCLCFGRGLGQSIHCLQLLFINLVNDSVPAIALGMEKAEPDVMEKAPRQLNEGIFANGLMRVILIRVH